MLDRSRFEAGSRMEPSTCAIRPQLTDEQWRLISDLFSDPKPDPRGGRPERMRGGAWKGFCGCCAAEPARLSHDHATKMLKLRVGKDCRYAGLLVSPV